MAANWIDFRKNMKNEVGLPSEISIDKLSDIHATEYVNAVKTAQIALTQSKLIAEINKDVIKTAYMSVFTKLLSETLEIFPNYNNENPNQAEALDRNKLEDIFSVVSSAIISEWSKAIFNTLVVPPGYVSSTGGYRIIIPGDPLSLSKDIAKAFFGAQTEYNEDVAFDIFITGLISAYTAHLLKITGTFSGTIPGTPPIQGPPFPWIGVI